MVDDPADRWSWPKLQAPLSWALGAGILIFEMLSHGRVPELIIGGFGLVGFPLVAPKRPPQ